jgi:hypothetical protein
MKGIGIRAAMALAACTATSGCSTLKSAWDADRTSNGGLIGHYADSVIPASSADMELYRATLVFAMVTQAADISLTNSYDISSFNTYMKGESEALLRAAGSLKSHCSDIDYTKIEYPTTCDAIFESKTIYIEQRMIPLIKAAFPSKEAEKIISDIEGQNWVASIFDVFEFSKTLLVDVHAGDSAMRSGYVILAKQQELSDKVNGADDLNVPSQIPNSILDQRSLKLKFDQNFSVEDWDLQALYAIIQNACVDMQGKVASNAQKPDCSFSYVPIVDKAAPAPAAKAPAAPAAAPAPAPAPAPVPAA